jgi:hypothetical protein
MSGYLTGKLLDRKICYFNLLDKMVLALIFKSCQVDILKALDPAYPHIVRDEELPAVDLKPATMQTREPASDFAEGHLISFQSASFMSILMFALLLHMHSVYRVLAWTVERLNTTCMFRIEHCAR